MARVQVKDDYYRVLEVSQTASHEVIRESYKKLALQLHPDRNSLPHATASFQLLGQAWETLKDKDKRAAYDHGYRLQQLKSAKPDAKRDTSSSTASGKRKHRHRRRVRHKQAVHPPEGYRRREAAPRDPQPECRETHSGNLPETLLWDGREAGIHNTRPIVDHISLIELLKLRIEDMEDKLEELDRLDDNYEEEIEGMSFWGLPWQDNWRVLHLEEQFEIREDQRRELVQELSTTLEKIRQLEGGPVMSDAWL